MKFFSIALATSFVATSLSPISAAPVTINTTFVAAKARDGVGTDAGIDVTGGAAIRLTASGVVAMRAAGCAVTEANGCQQGFGPRDAVTAPIGTLVATFVDRGGARIGSWIPVGAASTFAVPSGAARLLLKINGATASTSGSFKVVANVMSSAPGMVDARTLGVRRLFDTTRMVSSAVPVTRHVVQATLRRFGFGDTPENVTAVYKMGLQKWFAQQLDPNSIDDSKLAQYVSVDPKQDGTIFHNAGGLLCTYETMLLEHQMASNRQVLEKLTQHWLEHFSVNDTTTLPSPAGQYVNTVRRDALGNFAKLVADVAREPEMLDWLGNRDNNGASATSMPNQNFGREVMQIYTMGIDKLNMDGTPVLDATGQPVPNYTQQDVETVSLAMTGYGWYLNNFDTVGTVFDVPTVNVTTFNPKLHPKLPKSYNFLGQTMSDPGDGTVMDKVIKIMTQNPSTAPFESKELLQRLVTENPSPGYVSRVAHVWAATQDDPKQIAKVVNAIVSDPEYPIAVTQPMLREGNEYVLQAMRSLGSQYANPITASTDSPLSGLRTMMVYGGVHVMTVPTVFGFYTVGDKESVIDSSMVLERNSFADEISSNLRFGPTLPTNVQKAFCNTDKGFNVDARRVAALPGSQIANYLLDALVDGGTPELRSLVQNYVNNDPTHIAGAVYIIMMSPEYEVN